MSWKSNVVHTSCSSISSLGSIYLTAFPACAAFKLDGLYEDSHLYRIGFWIKRLAGRDGSFWSCGFPVRLASLVSNRGSLTFYIVLDQNTALLDLQKLCILLPFVFHIGATFHEWSRWYKQAPCLTTINNNYDQTPYIHHAYLFSLHHIVTSFHLH